MTDASAPERGYPGATVAAAALGTLFFPLIAALFLVGRERDDDKRRSLRTWAWASGGWIGFQILVFAIAAAAIFNGSSATKTDTTGPCVGGPQTDKPATVGADGKAVFPCAISGTATVKVP